LEDDIVGYFKQVEWFD